MRSSRCQDLLQKSPSFLLVASKSFSLTTKVAYVIAADKAFGEFARGS